MKSPKTHKLGNTIMDKSVNFISRVCRVHPFLDVCKPFMEEKHVGEQGFDNSMD